MSVELVGIYLNGVTLYFKRLDEKSLSCILQNFS